MKIKFVKQINSHNIGDIVSYNDRRAEHFIYTGYAVEVTDKYLNRMLKTKSVKANKNKVVNNADK